MQNAEVRARTIKDSRGKDTIEVWVNGQAASSPSGTATGSFENPSYHEDLKWNIHALEGLKFTFPINTFDDLEQVEEFLADAYALSKPQDFGANALLALETAILKALAAEKKLQPWQLINPNARLLPIPIGNVIGGGMHAGTGRDYPTFQEFLIIPQEKSFEENVRSMLSQYREIGKLLQSTSIDEEGGWQTTATEEDIFVILERFSEKSKIGVDVAATTFFVPESQVYSYKNTARDREQQITHINNFIDHFSLFYVEDPMDENDFSGFSRIHNSNLVVGDALVATNLERLQRAIRSKSINAVLIKPNQNGSLLAIREIFEYCHKKGIITIMSHRAGETMDDALSDLAFGFGASYIKCGIATPQREAKLKRMIEIERWMHTLAG